MASFTFNNLIMFLSDYPVIFMLYGLIYMVTPYKLCMMTIIKSENCNIVGWGQRSSLNKMMINSVIITTLTIMTWTICKWSLTFLGFAEVMAVYLFVLAKQKFSVLQYVRQTYWKSCVASFVKSKAFKAFLDRKMTLANNHAVHDKFCDRISCHSH